MADSRSESLLVACLISCVFTCHAVLPPEAEAQLAAARAACMELGLVVDALKRMARFLNRKSQRYYRLKFADTYYGEMTHYGLYRLAWADVRRTRD